MGPNSGHKIRASCLAKATAGGAHWSLDLLEQAADAGAPSARTLLVVRPTRAAAGRSLEARHADCQTLGSHVLDVTDLDDASRHRGNWTLSVAGREPPRLAVAPRAELVRVPSRSAPNLWYRPAAPDAPLSLIHISEPTRPY